jgi:uncharacterized OB-fold protein
MAGQTDADRRPLPVPTETSRPFWDALRSDVVRIQRCSDCGAWVFYPRSHCSECLSPHLVWTEVSGRGRLHTFTTARQATAPQFADDVPQILAVVELDEGPRLTTTLEPGDYEIGMPVEPVFDHVNDATTLLRYRAATPTA